jgi:Dolichyl-phosphate-mannose-protein mannosyltransferase
VDTSLPADRTKRIELIALVLCLLIGFVLRSYTIDRKSLWIDEVYTFNDSRYGLRDQIEFYKENPDYLHPPLFYVLTHLMSPFEKPERDLRVIPMIFGSLCIPMIYFLARAFSPGIALPCALSLTFMVYHISLSQDARAYTMLMFFGMAGLSLFMRYLKTLKNGYLALVALFFAILFYTSYSSILFIALSQVLWFYQVRKDDKKPFLKPFLFLNGLLLLFCIPWVLYLGSNFGNKTLVQELQAKFPLSFWGILVGVLHDWTPNVPFLIASAILLVLLPLFSGNRRNAFVLLAAMILPIAGLFLFCTVFRFGHFVNSRYFINFLPFFLMSVYLSLSAIDARLGRLRRFVSLKLYFIVLFVASNLLVLPAYYGSQKQDFRGMVNYLNTQLRSGDRIFLRSPAYFPGVLHYFGVDPGSRHYKVPSSPLDPQKGEEFKVDLFSQGRSFSLVHSNVCCNQYIADGNRLWIVLGKAEAQQIKKSSPAVQKGVFDGSFSNFRRFRDDASLYLFLWDPSNPEEKGMDIPKK